MLAHSFTVNEALSGALMLCVRFTRETLSCDRYSLGRVRMKKAKET